MEVNLKLSKLELSIPSKIKVTAYAEALFYLRVKHAAELRMCQSSSELTLEDFSVLVDQAWAERISSKGKLTSFRRKGRAVYCCQVGFVSTQTLKTMTVGMQAVAFV